MVQDLFTSVFEFSYKFSINTCFESGSDVALFTAETNLCGKQKSLKASQEPRLIFVNDVDFSLDSSVLSRALKAGYMVLSSSHQIESVLVYQRTILHPATGGSLCSFPSLCSSCSAFAASSLQHVNRGPASSTAINSPFLSGGIILLSSPAI